MADISRWNPVSELQRARDTFWRMFALNVMPSSVWQQWNDMGENGWYPSVDMHETEEKLVMQFAIPGVKQDNIDITVTKEALSIRGTIEQSEEVHESGYRRIERRYGTFQRTVPFPISVKHEQADATYKDGILEIRIPKETKNPNDVMKLRIRTDDIDEHPPQ